MSINEAFKQRRQERGISVAQVARAAGISEQTLGFFENGRITWGSPKGRKNLRRACKALGISYGHLVSGDKPEKAAPKAGHKFNGSLVPYLVSTLKLVDELDLPDTARTAVRSAIEVAEGR